MSIPNPPRGPAEGPEAWQPTREQTQLVRDETSYLEGAQPAIGRPVGGHRHELFVACEPAMAMRQQFEHRRPDFIAVHDVATIASPKLLAGIAAASQRAVQQLAIRRQGHGEPLATLSFVELPTTEGPALRIYATDPQADPAAREALARTLLAFSTLGVVFVGDAPPGSISGVLAPLHEAMIEGPWPNRQLLLLPLSTANALVAQGMELAHGTGVNVRTTPQVARPGDAWNFISSTWARVREPVRTAAGPSAAVGGPTRPGPAAGAAAPRSVPAPLPLRPMPEVGARASVPAASADVLGRYVQQLSALTGMVSCCIFDVASGRDLLHAGASPGPAELAEHGAELLATMLSVSRTLGLGHALPEAAVTLGAHHLVLRAVPRHPGLALHAVLDKTHANLTLARLQIARMDALFEPTPPA